MLAYIARRVLFFLPTLLGISVAVFLIVEFIPGDPARAILGDRATPEALADMRARLGLDRPLPVRFALFVKDLARGDMGRSLRTNRPIGEEIAVHFPATLELALAAMLLAALAGISAGVVSAVKRRSALDYAAMTGALVGVSMPVFWLGLMLLVVFSHVEGWPLSGRLAAEHFVTTRTRFLLLDSLLDGNFEAFRAALRHLFLPALALSTIPTAIIARQTRASMLEVLSQDYVRTAFAKGLAPRAVYLRHALKNALLPVVTVMGLSFGFLLGGAIITETVFAWPGVGRWILFGVFARDYKAIQGGALLIASSFVVINLLVDILYTWLNPRIKYG
jgi:ABC-type dipeptide/oligopeptide/nickel transport system permease component